jgi:two-component system, OmpR family, sensor histidine kinase CiaH
MFRSLRVRIALSHALVMIVILVVLGVTLQFVLARTLDASITRQLQASADGVAAHIVELGHPAPPPDSDVPSDAATRIAVYAPDGALVGERSETPSWLRPAGATVTGLDVSGQRVRVVTMPVTIGGSTVAWVVAGRSTVAEDDLVHRVRMLLLGASILAVLASLAAGWWLAGRAVRPVQRSYEARAAFAADASHELRTPLTFIRQGVEVLATHDEALGQQVLGEVDYMAGLSQRLLLLARAEGEPALTLEPIGIAVPIRQAAGRSERALGLDLRVDGVDGLAAVADTAALEIALDAVFENVARHGGGSAAVRARREGGEIVIDVADAGPGLPPDLHGRAFDRFFRADPSRARETGGAGLGLALTRAWVEAQRGRVSLGPTPGGGLTVSIGLPAAD